MTNKRLTGTVLGMPYDFRRPTMDVIRTRMWNPGGPMMPPKVFGVGWTLNFAHPGSWALLAVIPVLAMVAG